jgi:hypothetical protein
MRFYLWTWILDLVPGERITATKTLLPTRMYSGITRGSRWFRVLLVEMMAQAAGNA